MGVEKKKKFTKLGLRKFLYLSIATALDFFCKHKYYLKYLLKNRCDVMYNLSSLTLNMFANWNRTLQTITSATAYLFSQASAYILGNSSPQLWLISF